MRGDGGRRSSATWGGRDDEDDPLASHPTPVLVTVPAELVGDLRIGVDNELTAPAEGILEAVGRADPEPRYERFRSQLEYLDDLCALLELIGWSAPKHQAAVPQAGTALLVFGVASVADSILGAVPRSVRTHADYRRFSGGHFWR